MIRGKGKAVATLLLLLVAACTSDPVASSSGELAPGTSGSDEAVDGQPAATAPPDSERTIPVQAMDSFAFESVSDWASYADVVAIFTVVEEAEGESVDSRPGTRFVEQLFTLEIRQVIWESDTAAALEDQIRVRGPGFRYEGDERRRYDDGGERLIPDGTTTYVSALLFNRSRQRWNTMSVDSVIRVVDGVVDPDSNSPIAGLSLDAVQSALQAAPRYQFLDYSIEDPFLRSSDYEARLEQIVPQDDPNPAPVVPESPMTDAERDALVEAEERAALEALEEIAEAGE